MQQSRKLHITVQPDRAGAKSSTSKSPLGMVIDVQDAGKLSDPVATVLHIESQVGKPCNIMLSKTNLVCPQGNKSSLGVSLREMHASSTEKALAMLKNSPVPIYYKTN